MSATLPTAEEIDGCIDGYEIAAVEVSMDISVLFLVAGLILWDAVNAGWLKVKAIWG